MSLKEIKERHEALINWWLFEGYTVEAMISLINTLHKDRSELIRMVEELQAKLVEIKALLPKWYDIDDDFASICADELQAIIGAE